MSDLAQFPPPAGTICRLLKDRFGAEGRSFGAFSATDLDPRQVTRITLPKGSLFVIVESEKSSYTPQTNWGRKLMGETPVENVMAEVLCDSRRCIILLQPDCYELVE